MLIKNAKVVNDQFDIVDAEVQIQGENIIKVAPKVQCKTIRYTI